MRRRVCATLALLFPLLAAPWARAASAAPQDAPRSDESVRRALERGEQTLDVIAGVRDDVASPRLAAAHPDRTGEPERRARRLAAQKRLAEAMPAETFRLRRRYGSFSMLAGRATREAVLALANRSDVAWVTMDGVRREHARAPQASQLLMHSDQANALGFTGAGESIAILDTGVDYGIADMGGGAFPNAKVIGGRDVADGDDDPMDCEGHGTSVAAVAAGPTGVAPGARIVALKISKTASCDEAMDSDILAAIDWAILNQEAYAISAINLSFGGPPADGADHGYCDEAFPQYAVAIESALAAGIVFVASAGNEGLSNAIAVPACVSSAVSVGAVYPESFVRVAWQNDTGGTLCEDAPASPDAIVCFSNSASTLSLLAPGAFWDVATKGGAFSQFHGTSASAPAAAGAAALARQAHPGLSAAAVASLLRGTGRPISDPRNGILTPRVDALAAVQIVSGSFAPSGGAPVAIPDASGFATATATASGFSGLLAGVEAVVEIAHPDPRQLGVRLTGPDGTTVLLHDHTGSPEHPINGIYGRTLASAESLGAFQGKEGNGVWTLTVEDRTPSLSGRIQGFAVHLIAGQPSEPIPPSEGALVLPVVGHVQGSRLFLSDARLYNPSSKEQSFSLFYVPQGRSGTQAVRATRTVAPGRVLALDDVVGSEFGYANSIGELTIVGPEADAIVTSRSYTRSPDGTFGLFVPSVRRGDGLGPGERATANGLVKNAQFHTNAGFTEISGSPVSVRMDIHGGDGTLLASTTRGAGANGTVLVTDIIGDRGLGVTPNFRIDYTVVGGSGRAAPFATFVDNATGDGVFQAAIKPPVTSDDTVIPQASHATGANRDFFRTDLHITNLGEAPVSVSVSLVPRVLTGEPTPPLVLAIGPGQTIEKLDVLAEFGLSDPSAAGVRIHPTGPARLAVSSRTYVRKSGGTFGFSIPGQPASEGLVAGGGTATVIQLDQTTSARGFRSNFGFAEVGGGDVAIRVTARSGDDGAVLGSRTYSLAAGRSFQASVADVAGSSPRANLYLQFSVESGPGRVLAYGVSIDNTSGDAIYIPAQKEPQAPLE